MSVGAFWTMFCVPVPAAFVTASLLALVTFFSEFPEMLAQSVVPDPEGIAVVMPRPFTPRI